VEVWLRELEDGGGGRRIGGSCCLVCHHHCPKRNLFGATVAPLCGSNGEAATWQSFIGAAMVRIAAVGQDELGEWMGMAAWPAHRNVPHRIRERKASATEQYRKTYR
jgi:hypothetical protein